MYSRRNDSRSPRNSNSFGGGGGGGGMNRRPPSSFRGDDRGDRGPMGGGGGGGGSNMSQMNPWQGGMAPAGVNQLSSLSGPTSILSQLSSANRETQLAMATNLLKFLSPESQPGPPSLLGLPLNRNLGSSFGGGFGGSSGSGFGGGSGGGFGGGSGSGFGGGSGGSFGGGSGGGFGGGRGGVSTDNRSKWTGTSSFADRRRDRSDNRRKQPYNKSGSNRQEGKARFGSGKPNRSNSEKFGSPNKFNKKKEPEKKDVEEEVKDAKKVPEEDTNKESKRQEEGAAKENDDKKNDGKESPKKDENAENKASDPGKYVGIPQKMLRCHICQKSMWDSTSFDKHLNGRSHQMMMEQRNSAYTLKVDLLHHEQRAIEMQREMEIERFQRQGKKVFNNKRSYCKMCDLNFFGSIVAHRKREQHMKLKAFLHPKCTFCDKEFPDRMRMDEHKLTAKHLQVVAEHRRNKSPGKTDEEIDCDDSLDEDDEFYETKQKKNDIDLTDIPTEIGSYDSKTSIGDNLVVDVIGHLCRSCDKFFYSKEEADSHLRSFTHYKSYSSLVNAKAQIEKDKKEEEKTAKDGEEVENEEEDGHAEEKQNESDKPSQADDSEGTWKRRKRDSDENDDKGDSEEEEDEGEADNGEVQAKKQIKIEKDDEEKQIKIENNDVNEDKEKTEVQATPTRSSPAKNRAFRGSARGRGRRGGK